MNYIDFKHYTNNIQPFIIQIPINNHGGLTTPRQDWNEESMMRRYRDSRVEELRMMLLNDEAKPPKGCPECGSDGYVRYGRTAKGTERFRCKSCGRTFTPKRLISNSQIPEEKWMVFAECYVCGTSVRGSADRCGVSASTAYRMKCRIDDLVGGIASDEGKNVFSDEHPRHTGRNMVGGAV